MWGLFLFLIGHFLKFQLAVRFLYQHFDPAFGPDEPFLTFAGKLHALLKQLEAFLKRQVAVLKFADDRFKLVE